MYPATEITAGLAISEQIASPFSAVGFSEQMLLGRLRAAGKVGAALAVKRAFEDLAGSLSRDGGETLLRTLTGDAAGGSNQASNFIVQANTTCLTGEGVFGAHSHVTSSQRGAGEVGHVCWGLAFNPTCQLIDAACWCKEKGIEKVIKAFSDEAGLGIVFGGFAVSHAF